MKQIKELFIALKEQWIESRFLFILETLGVMTSIAGALLMGFGSPNPPLMAVFLSYTVGSLSLLWVSFKRRHFWIMFLMGFYTITNFIGIFNIVY